MKTGSGSDEGLVCKAHRLVNSLRPRLDSNKEEEVPGSWLAFSMMPMPPVNSDWDAFHGQADTLHGKRDAFHSNLVPGRNLEALALDRAWHAPPHARHVHLHLNVFHGADQTSIYIKRPSISK